MAACRGVSSVFALLTVPVIITKLGVVGFGIWEAIFSVALLCSLMQSATINTMLWQMSNAYGAKNEEKIQRLVQIGITVILVQVVVVVSVVWLFRYEIIKLLQVPQDMFMTCVSILPIFCGLVVFNGASECIGAIISGYQRAGLVTMVQTIAQVLNYSISIGCLLFGFGLISMFIGYVVNYLFAGIAYFFIARRYCIGLKLLPTVPTTAELRELYGYFTLMAFGSITAVMRDQKDKLVLATLFTPAWTGYYSIAMRLIGFITLMNSFFYVPVMAAVGAINAQGKWSKIKRIYGDVIVTIAVLVGFMAVIIAGLHERLVLIWIGKDIPEVGVILLWLVFGSITAILLTGPGTAICKGIGLVKIEASYWGVGIILNIVFTVVLINTHGALGSVAASSLSWVFSSMFFLWLLHRHIDLPLRSTWLSVKALFVVIFSVALLRTLSFFWPLGTNRMEVLMPTFSLVAIALVCYLFLLATFKIIPLNLNLLLSLVGRRVVPPEK